MENERFISTKETRKLLGVTHKTLVNWDKKGKINTIKSPSGIRMYSFKDVQNILGCDVDIKEKKKIAYCRVSSQKQKDDLERQKDFFRHHYPDYIVVAHRDRLCRFGFELFQWIFERNEVELIVLDRENHKSPDEELTDDILSIIHVYSCRRMGGRRYQIKEDKDLSGC